MEIVTNDSSDSNDDNNRPGTNRVRFLEEIVLFPITILGGRYVVDNGHWFRHRPGQLIRPVPWPRARDADRLE